MAPLTDDEKEWIKMVAREVGFQVVKEATAEHIASCPHGKNLGKFRAWLIGVAVGCSLGGGAGGFALAKIML